MTADAGRARDLPCGHPGASWGRADNNPAREMTCLWCGDIVDMKMLINHLSRTYDHFSGGRISKPNTLPEEVFAVADELAQEDHARAIAAALEVVEQHRCFVNLDCPPYTKMLHHGDTVNQTCAAAIAAEIRKALA